MSTFFWILGLLTTAGLTFIVCYYVIDNQLGSEWAAKQNQLTEDRQNFKKSYADAQQWYSQALKSAQDKGTELNRKEKELQELKTQLEIQISKNNEDKEKFIASYKMHLKDHKLYIKKLEVQLENARQRGKRFEKQAKNQV
jgi:hypothetical protein